MSDKRNLESPRATSKKPLFLIVSVCVWALLEASRGSLKVSDVSRVASFDLPDMGLPTSTSSASALDSEQLQKRLLSLTELTDSAAALNVKCEPPFVPIHDRVFDASHVYSNSTRIPRVIHISMKGRCLHELTALGIQKWKDHFPNYAFFYHDDNAVQRLLQEPWPEFPNLRRMLNCVMYKGAMLIDVWRILVIYRYGGIYADVDVWPGEIFNETTLTPDTEAFFMTDGGRRPSQWFFAGEVRHPIFYFTMMQILERIYTIPNIYQPKVVQITGPEALRWGFSIALGTDPYKLPGEGLFVGKKYGKTAVKVGGERWYQKNVDDPIEWTHSNGTVVKTDVRAKVNHDSGIMHWQKEVYKDKRTRQEGRVSCVDLLYEMDKNWTTPSVLI